MRLTLRTLLAYLDDVLDASRRREIARKLRRSQAARAMVAQVRLAGRLRRAREKSDGDTGKRFDPNLIGEYLDNLLTPEQVAHVEKICLASRTELEEIAACHGILKQVLTTPAQHLPGAKRRMYALAPSPGPDAAKPATRSDDEEQTPVGEEKPSPTPLPQAEFRPERGRNAKLAAAAVLLLTAGWAVIYIAGLFSDSTRREERNGDSDGNRPAYETGKFEGVLEKVGAEGISGWVWDENRPETPLNVLILDHETVVAYLPASEFRQDLLDAAKGDGRHGFRCPLPDALQDGKPHKVRARISKTRFELKGSPWEAKKSLGTGE